MIRLQKLLAGAGLGSRRAIEEWIRAGRLTVNGRLAQLGDRATPGDDVRLDGKPLQLAGAAADSGTQQLLIYNKPLDEVTTRSDPQGRRTVFDSLPPARAGRWISIGRLDVNTSGLLLFTTDGELAHRLMHPSSEVEREYRVTVRGQPSAEALRQLRTGVLLEDGPAKFDKLDPAVPAADLPPGAASSPTAPDPWQRGRLRFQARAAAESLITPASGDSAATATFKVVLREGRNREVRRMWLAVGHEILQLARTRYGPVELPADLPRGQWREIPIEKLAAAIRRAPSDPI